MATPDRAQRKLRTRWRMINNAFAVALVAVVWLFIPNPGPGLALLGLAAFMFSIYPLNWLLRYRARRLGRQETKVGLSFATPWHTWRPLSATESDEEWSRLLRYPTGATLKGCWECLDCPMTLLTCNDESGKEWHLLGNVIKETTVQFMAGPMLQRCVDAPGGQQPKWHLRLFQRAGWQWPVLTPIRLADVLNDITAGSQVDGPALGWANNGDTMVCLLDRDGRDFLIWHGEEPDDWLRWQIGLFVWIAKRPARASQPAAYRSD